MSFLGLLPLSALQQWHFDASNVAELLVLLPSVLALLNTKLAKVLAIGRVKDSLHLGDLLLNAVEDGRLEEAELKQIVVAASKVCSDK